MNIQNHILVLIIMLNLCSCKDKKVDVKQKEITKNTNSNLLVDHLNVWVENPKKTKEKLTNIGFKSVPDSLSQIHMGQGTTGKYFNFLNGYLELIFILNQKEFELNNKKNSELDFKERASFKKSGASPFSIALKLKDYKLTKIPFKTIRYHQDWMDENKNIYSAKNSKTILNEPSLFVVYPEIESERFNTLLRTKKYSSRVRTLERILQASKWCRKNH
ncbi:hypothetical protein [Lacinutrix sp. Bg11-31]|uniref:hypothetical protein n=1 Tax=Lacinutrix sp. Bg11-31 TaxID=2057808 RepID=UPI000C30553B|nr:hypothetical protein [Lacinutrix sp. Bg11-31]AUC81666.1 hypothetical protein CW733_05790 [Lacinutrix sp. Bg11-31]